MIRRLNARRARALWLAPIALGALLTLAAGCKQPEPESNAATAAPARLPGEDPHAHHSPSGADNGKKGPK